MLQFFYTGYSNGSGNEFLKKKYRDLLVVIGVVLLILTLATKVGFRWKDPKRPNGLPYCDSEYPGTFLRIALNRTDCQACSSFGYCSGGLLLACEPPFAAESAICVRPGEPSRFAMRMVSWYRNRLSRMAGSRECYGHSGAGITEREMRNETLSRFIEERPGVPIGELRREFEELYFVRFWRMLYDNQMNFELNIERILTDDGIAGRVELLVSSTRPRFTAACRVRMAVGRFKSLLAPALAVTALAFLCELLKRRRASRNEKIGLVASIAMTRLKAAKGCCSVDSMKKDIGEIQFDSPVPLDSLWNDAVELVESDSRVACCPGEREERAWYWTGQAN